MKKKRFTKKKKMNRKNLLSLARTRGIKKYSNKKKIELTNDIKLYEISEMKKTCIDGIDPITLETFEEWDLQELLDRIFLNGYFYKKTSIQTYIETNLGKDKILDPIRNDVEIPGAIVSEWSKNVEYALVKDTDFSITVETAFCATNIFTYTFYKILFHIHSDNKMINTKLKKISQNKYLIGFIPMNIVCSPNPENFGEMKSLDASSTSNALLIRIISLYESQKMFSKTIENEQIVVKKLKNLPTRCVHWFSEYDGYQYIDTRCKMDGDPLSVYNLLQDDILFAE